MSISVIIPTYNGARFLREAVESVWAQTQRPLELIVVDDCSRDGTVELAKSLASASPIAMHIHRLPTNSGGPPRPINVGVGLANGEWIAVLDQDDVYEPEIMAQAAAAIQDAPNCCMALWWFGLLSQRESGPRQTLDLRQRLVSSGAGQGANVTIDGKKLLIELVEQNNFLGGYPAFLFRRRDWLRKGGVDETLRIASDSEMLGWLFQQGPAALIPHVGYWRREHDTNACRNVTLMYVESAVVVARLLLSAPGLREEFAARQRAIAWIRSLAYWFRQGHEYAAARQTHRLLRDLGDGPLTTICALAKLETHRVLARALRRPPNESSYTTSVRRTSTLALARDGGASPLHS